MDPSDVVELEGRHNAGFGIHFRWKIMRINSEQRWGAYKEVVAESLDKALELFATKKIGGTLHVDLNRSASRVDARNSPPNHQEEMTDGRPISKEALSLEEEDDECGDDDNDIELHDHNVGDLDMYYTQVPHTSAGTLDINQTIGFIPVKHTIRVLIYQRVLLI
jgi:hypothetical protein